MLLLKLPLLLLQLHLHMLVLLRRRWSGSHRRRGSRRQDPLISRQLVYDFLAR
jgi:hypothetical protein